jgi:CPA2 family monovalent cation:H+ antiporter-2
LEFAALGDVLILLLLAVGAVVLLRRLGVTPILGYLLVGVLAGPHGLGLVPEHAGMHVLAEVGVAFLLFAIGLEFSLPQLLSMRRVVLGLGAAQVLPSALLIGLAVWALGLSPQSALIVGGALAMSSTAIVMKQLVEQLELHSRHGRAAVGILLFQDLAVVPLLVLIPLLAADGEAGLALPLLLALAKGAAVLVAMLVLGRWVLRPLFHAVASGHSAELFTLAVLLVSLASAWTTHALGLSLALGAFLAGMMLSETEFRHQVETDIRPFRDVLMGLFFVTVGMRLDVSVLPAVWGQVLLLLALLTLGKAAIIVMVARVARYPAGVAIRTGLVLAQGGEFGFALLALALSNDLLDARESAAVLSAVVLSMALAPVLIRYNARIADALTGGGGQRAREREAQRVSEATRGLDGHVIVCGFGRVGQNLGRMLREQGLDYVALDLDPGLVREAWEAGEPVFFGDSTHAELLEAAGLMRAAALVVSVDDPHAAERILTAVRARREDLPLLVRAHDDADLDRLEEMGATEVVPEALETSLMLAEHLLPRLGISIAEVQSAVARVREEHYRGLRGFFHGAQGGSLEQADASHLHTVVLDPGAGAIGCSLGSLGLAEMGVDVQALCRSGVRGDDPDPGTRLLQGDALILQGLPEHLEHAEERLVRG